MKFKFALICAALGLAAANASACYTVYGANNRVVYQGADAPVDMSRPLHQTLPRRFPGGHMVFDLSNLCEPVSVAQVPRTNVAHAPVNTVRIEGTRRATPVSTGPMLTDRRTAQRMNLPHTEVSGDVVMVPAETMARVNLRPGVTVVPGAEFSEVAAVPATATMGAGPAPTKPTVITEMRNPPMTVIQRGDSYVITK